MKIIKQNINLNKGLIILFTLLTAGIHFSLNFAMKKVDPLFTLNGLGYLVLLGTYILRPGNMFRYARWLRIIFIGFTILTVVLWIFLGKPYTAIGMIDKFIEILLIILLVFDRPKFD
jgi:hypothetical protein